jgi:hypothetical protein
MMFTNIDIIVNLEPNEIKNFSNITKINNYERQKSGFKLLLKNQFKQCIQVRYIHTSQQIIIAGNFTKFFQGHSLFGSDNLIAICADVIQRVLIKLDISLSTERLATIAQGEFEVYSACFGKVYQADPTDIEHLITKVKSSWKKMSTNQCMLRSWSSEHVMQTGENWSFKLTTMASNLREDPLTLKLPGSDKLRKFAEGLILVEYAMEEICLADFKLLNGYDWSSEKKLERLFQKRLMASGLLEHQFFSDIPSELKTMEQMLVG